MRKVRLSTKIKKFNEWLAVNMTVAAGTVWTFYLFMVLCFLPMVLPAWQPVILYVSNCFQLMLLPLIMVGQTVMSKKTERRAEKDHEMLIIQLRYFREIAQDIRTLLLNAGIDPDAN